MLIALRFIISKRISQREQHACAAQCAAHMCVGLAAMQPDDFEHANAGCNRIVAVTTSQKEIKGFVAA
jgi:hypothetical protein